MPTGKCRASGRRTSGCAPRMGHKRSPTWSTGPSTTTSSSPTTPRSSVPSESQAGKAPTPSPPGARGPIPMPPGPPMYGAVLSSAAAERVGLHPYEAPTAANSVAYDGRPACNNCGFCAFFGCPIHAKGDPVALLTKAMGTGRAQLMAETYVSRILTDGRRATGVEYIDARAASAPWTPGSSSWPEARSRRRAFCCSPVWSTPPSGATSWCTSRRLWSATSRICVCTRTRGVP